MILIASRMLLRVLTFGRARALAIFPIVIVESRKLLNDRLLIRHERIHLRQQIELLILPFYIWYLTEYFIYRAGGDNHNKAYRRISFEREAYENERNEGYLKGRRLWAFLRYI